MRTLFCHPDNLEILKTHFTPVSRIDPRIPASLDSVLTPLDGIKCIADHYMPRTRKTGKYILPDGRAVTEDQVHFSDRFTQFGPEDIQLALFMQWITEEETLAFYIVTDKPLLRNFIRPDFNFVTPQDWTSITNVQRDS